ncbi:MAG: hypothetical protein P4L93_10730 [Coriobacteriia bacterium]|nr:hypothetical protein [Coriobacteriia bacterium]
MTQGTADERPPTTAALGRVVGEARWPMAVAVLAIIGLTLLLPHDLIVRPRWGVPILELVLLVALIIADPGKIDRVSKWVHALSTTLIGVLVATALWCTAEIIVELIKGGPSTNSAASLLAAGGIVWLSNCLAFGLLYWELDSGGPAVRAHGLSAHPDFAFPQHLSPELAPRDWRPQFIDYLYLGFTAATAFSPTDVMPLRAWNKIAMMLQSTVSLALVGLVIARAVNVLA